MKVKTRTFSGVGVPPRMLAKQRKAARMQQVWKDRYMATANEIPKNARPFTHRFESKYWEHGIDLEMSYAMRGLSVGIRSIIDERLLFRNLVRQLL